MRLQVARIGKPHGIRGEVTVQLYTDDPDSRFAVGTSLMVDAEGVGPLTVRSRRWNKNVLLLGFDEVPDRNGAERLRNCRLVIDAEDDDGDDTWYEHQLAGLRARVMTGAGHYIELGTVTALQTGAAQDLLVIDTATGDVLVPFVKELVPEVHTDAGYVLLTPPDGLFDLDDDAAGGDA